MKTRITAIVAGWALILSLGCGGLPDDFDTLSQPVSEAEEITIDEFGCPEGSEETGRFERKGANTNMEPGVPDIDEVNAFLRECRAEGAGFKVVKYFVLRPPELYDVGGWGTVWLNTLKIYLCCKPTSSICADFGEEYRPTKTSWESVYGFEERDDPECEAAEASYNEKLGYRKASWAEANCPNGEVTVSDDAYDLKCHLRTHNHDPGVQYCRCNRLILFVCCDHEEVEPPIADQQEAQQEEEEGEEEEGDGSSDAPDPY